MKKLLFSSLFAACAAMGLSSCMNGDYDATPTSNNGSTNPLNPTGGGSGGSGGGSGGGGGSFNWSGTDPISAKIDGTAYTGSSATFSSSSVGSIQFDAITASLNGGTIIVGFPVNAAPGTYGSNTTGTAFNYSIVENGQNNGYGSNIFGGSGQIQIAENDATHVKGRFSGTANGSNGKSHVFTEGYFNVTK